MVIVMVVMIIVLVVVVKIVVVEIILFFMLVIFIESCSRIISNYNSISFSGLVRVVTKAVVGIDVLAAVCCTKCNSDSSWQYK